MAVPETNQKPIEEKKEPEIPAEEFEEESEDVPEGAAINNIGNLFGPEAVIMLPIAIILDIVGVICTLLIIFFGISEIFSWISDIVGIIIFGLWLLMKMVAAKIFATSEEVSPEITVAGEAMVSNAIENRRAARAAVRATRVAGKRGLRFSVTLIGEIIPIIGTLPFWTWFVYSELKSE